MSIAGFVTDLSLSGNVQFNGRILGNKGADISSGQLLTLGNGNYFDITGHDDIDAIYKEGWTDGSVIHLHFPDSALTLSHIGIVDPNYYAFFFQSGTDVTVSVNEILSFVFDSSGYWRCLNPTK